MSNSEMVAITGAVFVASAVVVIFVSALLAYWAERDLQDD